MQTPNVEYRDIPGFPGYRVGDDGSVWSKHERWPKRSWRKLSMFENKSGYIQVSLWSNGERRMCYAHRLIALAFMGECPSGMEVCHNDGDPTNNNINNLRYGTRKDNMDDQRRLGTLCMGTRRWNAILDESKVKLIRKSSARGSILLATEFGVTPRAIRKVINRDTWKHVA